MLNGGSRWWTSKNNCYSMSIRSSAVATKLVVFAWQPTGGISRIRSHLCICRSMTDEWTQFVRRKRCGYCSCKDKLFASEYIFLLSAQQISRSFSVNFHNFGFRSQSESRASINYRALETQLTQKWRDLCLPAILHESVLSIIGHYMNETKPHLSSEFTWTSLITSSNWIWHCKRELVRISLESRNHHIYNIFLSHIWWEWVSLVPRNQHTFTRRLTSRRPKTTNKQIN